MKQVLKTLGAIVLAITLCVGTIGVSQAVKAETDKTIEIENYKIHVYMTEDGKPTSTLIVGYTGSETELALPTHFIYNKMEIPLIGVSENAFKDNKSITKIIVPEGYEFLSSGIFDGCDNLRVAIVGESVAYVPDGVFGNAQVIRGTEEAKYKKVIGGNGGGGSESGSTEPKSPYEKGASFDRADKAITAFSSEGDPAGSVYGLLQLKQKTVKKNAIKVAWKKVPGAVKYAYYATNCGKKNKYVKHGITTGTSFNYKKICGKKLKKAKYYKIIVIAIDAKNKVVSTSKTVHVATKGGKVGNDKKVKVKKSKASIAANKTFKIKAKEIKAKKTKVKRHRAVKYESLNASIATVNAKGVVTGKKKGTVTVFAYAQNGMSGTVKITVK